MKNMHFLLGCIVILICFPYYVTGQIKKSLKFDEGKVERVTVHNKDKQYDCIRFKGGYNTPEVGKPGLPVCYYRFFIPKGQEVTGVTFNSSKQDDILLNYDLMPAQHRIPISFTGKDTIFDMPDLSVYNNDKPFPMEQAKIFHTDYYDGDLKIVTVEIFPMQYLPKNKKIIFTRIGEVSLITAKQSDRKSAISTNVISKTHDKLSLSLVSSLVENPQDVQTDKFSSSVSNSLMKANTATSSTWSIPFYEYVVITSQALKPAFNQLVNWKKRKGIDAGIVCIEDILSDPYAVGDATSSLFDNAGKLRQYLLDGYNANIIKYALLGGDNNIVPIRYGYFTDYPFYNLTWDNGSAKIPSDLYYSDFNTNWTAGNPSRTGTYYTGFDYAPEIFVGRVLCNSENDISRWTEKTLKYEQNPGNGDYSYLSKVLFTEADYLGTIDPQVLPSIFTTKDIWSELPSDGDAWPTFPTGHDVIVGLNNNYGLYSSFNHGGPLNYGTATHGIAEYGHDVHYSVVSVDAYDLDDNLLYSAKPEYGNGCDNLTNTNYPTLCYSISCSTEPFDNYRGPDAQNNPQFFSSDMFVFGKAYTAAFYGGGPIYIGNTRDAWNWDAQNLYTNFLNNIVTSHSPGIAEANSKIGFGDHWTNLTHNLVGCPETPMWLATPSVFSSATVSESGSNLTVNTGGITAEKICVMSALNSDYYQIQENVSSATFTNVPPLYYVTITKSDYIPYQNNPTTIYFQNQNLSSTSYLNCQQAFAGYDVDPSQTQGNVIVQNGANLTLDATGDIVLDRGFEVQAGARFEAK